MSNVPYGENITKWGELARAILKQPELISLFISDGIKEEEIKAIDTTEQEAERADRAQREASQMMQRLTAELSKEKDALISLFGELKRKAANAIGDLEDANHKADAQMLSDIDFSSTAAPKIKGESYEDDEDGLEASKKVVKEVVAEGQENPEGVAQAEGEESAAVQRESKSQRAIALAARRLANYLAGKDKILAALYGRKMPSDFLKTLKEKSDRMGELRNERAIALGKKKGATRAEYEATAKHIKARGKVEPTATILAKKNEALKALMSLHLGRKGK